MSGLRIYICEVILELVTILAPAHTPDGQRLIRHLYNYAAETNGWLQEQPPKEGR